MGHRRLLLAPIGIEKRELVPHIPAVRIGQANRADKAGRKIACDSLQCVSCRGGCREMNATQFTRLLIRRSRSVAKTAPLSPAFVGYRNLGNLRFEDWTSSRLARLLSGLKQHRTAPVRG